MRILRQIVDAAELVTAGQVLVAAAVLMIVVIMAFAGNGFGWRVCQWAS